MLVNVFPFSGPENLSLEFADEIHEQDKVLAGLLQTDEDLQSSLPQTLQDCRNPNKKLRCTLTSHTGPRNEFQLQQSLLSGLSCGNIRSSQSLLTCLRTHAIFLQRKCQLLSSWGRLDHYHFSFIGTPIGRIWSCDPNYAQNSSFAEVESVLFSPRCWCSAVPPKFSCQTAQTIFLRPFSPF